MKILFKYLKKSEENGSTEIKNEDDKNIDTNANSISNSNNNNNNEGETKLDE